MPAATSNKWGYIVEPYFLAPTMSGTSGVRGLTADSGITRLGTVDVDVEQGGVLASGYRRVAPWAEAQLGAKFHC